MPDLHTMQQAEPLNTRERAIRRVLWITLALNIGVAAAKIIFGALSGLISLQADGYHTAADAVSNIVALTMIAFAQKPADSDHPYGHQKLEVVASLFIAILVVFGLVEIGRGVHEAYHHRQEVSIKFETYLVLIITIVVNFGISTYERYQGNRLQSIVLKADASHTLTDSIAAVAVFVGMVMVDHGYHYADLIAAAVVMCFIAYTAFVLFRDALSIMVDTAYLDANAIKALVESHPQVQCCHYIRSRGLPGHIHLEFHLALDGSLSLMHAGNIMKDVKQTVIDAHPEVCDILVQLEPNLVDFVDDVPSNLV